MPIFLLLASCGCSISIFAFEVLFLTFTFFKFELLRVCYIYAGSLFANEKQIKSRFSYTQTHICTHTHTHARTHARTHAHCVDFVNCSLTLLDNEAESSVTEPSVHTKRSCDLLFVLLKETANERKISLKSMNPLWSADHSRQRLPKFSVSRLIYSV